MSEFVASILASLVALFGSGDVQEAPIPELGGPTSRLERSMMPEADSTYFFGTTSPFVIAWSRIVADSFYDTDASDGCATFSSNILTSTGVACGSGGGGGTDGNWSFFNNSGIRLATTTNQVLIGGSATSTLDLLQVYGAVRATHFTATSTTASSTFPNLLSTNSTSTNATSTNLRVSGTLSLTNPLSTANGGTGLSNPGAVGTGALLQFNGSSGASALSAGAAGAVITSNGNDWQSGTVALGDSDAVSGDLPFANLTQGAANTVLANTTGATADFAALATSSLFAGSNGQVLARVGGTWVGIATTTAGTGLTYTGSAFNVNTSQNISTLSNLTTNGFVRTSGGTGALSVQTDPCTYAMGCTGSTTAPVSQLLYGGASAFQSVATTSSTIGGSLSYSGTFGSLVGGVSGTLSLNMGNANTWTALQTFGNSSTTLASFSYASSTAWFGGGLNTDCDTAATSKLLWDITTGKFSCGTDQNSGGGSAPNSKWATSTASTVSIHTAEATRVGIGTTTPGWSLQIASSTNSQLSLSDGSATSFHWTWRSINSNLYLATSSPSTFATSSRPILFISSSGTTTISGVGAATSTQYVYSTGSGKGGSIILEDQGGGACTEVVTKAGVLSAAVVTCPTEL